MREFLRQLVPWVGVRTCLRCCFFIFPVLRERVGYLKGEEGEHESMCKLMDDLIRDDRLDRAKRLIKNFDNLTLEDISFVVDLPLSTIEELASQIPKEA